MDWRKKINTVKVHLSSRFLVMRYSNSEETRFNWGDALNPYIVSKLTRKKIVHFKEVDHQRMDVYSAVGSILDGNRIRNLIVWGSGLKSDLSAIPILPKKILAVRGPLTRKRLMSLGAECPENYGDPALLIPNFYKPASTRKIYKVGIVPHYVDEKNPNISRLLEEDGVKLISIKSDIESFIEQINECELIASSSLHGLIAADAYHIPRVWLQFSKLISGGRFKFIDYFLSVGDNLEEPLVVNELTTRMEISNAFHGFQMKRDFSYLLDLCPFADNNKYSKS